MGRTLEECMQIIKEPVKEQEQVRLGVVFERLSDIDDEAICGNCLVFSMAEHVAEALCDMEKAIPEGLSAVELPVPRFLSTGVRYMHSDQEQIVTPFGKGGLDDELVDGGEDNGYYPDNAFIRVSKNSISIVVFETDGDDITHRAVAVMPGETLIEAVRKAQEMTPEMVEETMQKFFEESGTSPSMSC